MNDTKPNPKPGYKTTEFWMTLLSNVILAVNATLETIDATWAAVAVTILTSIYALSRMGTKAAVERANKTVPLLLVCAVISAALPSCAALRSPNINGPSFYYKTASGAKGGLTVSHGKTTFWGRYPIKNPKTEEILGWAHMTSPEIDLLKNQPLPVITPAK